MAAEADCPSPAGRSRLLDRLTPAVGIHQEVIGMRLFLIAAMFALGGAMPARSQTVMDGSDASLSPADLVAFRQAFSRLLPDPYSAQIMGLKMGNDRLCGNVNAKNNLGRYVGFRLFGLLLSKREIVIAPNYDEKHLNHLAPGDRALTRQVTKGELQAYLNICRGLINSF
jgi:hypothetical protein